ncbi:hypothetical protein BOX15_Mlig024056g1 [Macrostomum lignano]|uniref:Uncharacterized protein n=1 Tax=Macrostomum lignano TaxID=282301 RepID=A0A267H818_9PLAT|nr:hypothetical protein BOX15_Mlig024056g1 [Macrostomum lignano]
MSAKESENPIKPTVVPAPSKAMSILPETLMQPYASLRHLEVNHYPMCRSNLTRPPGSALRSVSPAIVDTVGSFPYLLFRLQHAGTGLVIHCIRGSAKFPDDSAIERLYSASFNLQFFITVQGGGFIQIGSTSIQIHGASTKFGRADHHLAGKLLKFCFPQMKVQFEPNNQAGSKLPLLKSLQIPKNKSEQQQQHQPMSVGAPSK